MNTTDKLLEDLQWCLEDGMGGPRTKETLAAAISRIRELESAAPQPAAEVPDAERYRWLIAHMDTHRLRQRKGAWFCLPNNATEGRGYSTASAAIDAAIAAPQRGRGE
ncbi:hypothetical protein [Cupriavidus taiwanensis]|uniref:hypothetical protein n=1 Tax=Cupriavidus taiwanensis TaxID=164546 RepID=UPI000E15C17E|nr:hypothetical protein [Cupriavidus taiwanensis]SPA44652.1 hypothetical protein CBM2629_A150454 [Cupriavidus taiwanensis]